MTLDSGQVFHWEKSGNGFVGTIGDCPVHIEQDGNALRAKVAAASSRVPSRRWAAMTVPGLPIISRLIIRSRTFALRFPTIRS